MTTIREYWSVHTPALIKTGILKKLCVDPTSDWLEKSDLYIIYEDGEPIGFLKYTNDQYMIPYATYIERLFVREEFRRHGYATQLLKALIDSDQDIDLFVNKDNSEAIKLYEKLGFKRDGTVIGDEIFMYRKRKK